MADLPPSSDLAPPGPDPLEPEIAGPPAPVTEAEESTEPEPVIAFRQRLDLLRWARHP